MTAPTEISWEALYRPPTRDEALEMVARNLAGPWPGPNRITVAVILAEHLLRLAEREGQAWWVE